MAEVGSPRGSPTGVVPLPAPGAAEDQRQQAAELVLRAYVRCRAGDELVLLSELQVCSCVDWGDGLGHIRGTAAALEAAVLAPCSCSCGSAPSSWDLTPLLILGTLPWPSQGSFAFAIYDSDRHCAFAARDTSGREALFYEIDEDNALSLANAELAVPHGGDGGGVQWAELPPGHYISGARPGCLCVGARGGRADMLAGGLLRPVWWPWPLEGAAAGCGGAGLSPGECPPLSSRAPAALAAPLLQGAPPSWGSLR